MNLPNFSLSARHSVSGFPAVLIEIVLEDDFNELSDEADMAIYINIHITRLLPVRNINIPMDF